MVAGKRFGGWGLKVYGGINIIVIEAVISISNNNIHASSGHHKKIAVIAATMIRILVKLGLGVNGVICQEFGAGIWGSAAHAPNPGSNKLASNQPATLMCRRVYMGLLVLKDVESVP